MLTDHERKLLRILSVSTQMYKRTPSIDVLETKTGYRRGDIMTAIAGLEQQGYIVWPERRIEDIAVIEGFERQPARPVTKPNNLDYWTRY